MKHEDHNLGSENVDDKENPEERGSDLEANDDVNTIKNDDMTSTSWPQSYRQSMDIYTSVSPPSIGFLSRIGTAGKISQAVEVVDPNEYSSLSKPLICETDSSNKEPSVFLTSFTQSSFPKFSYSELPPPKQQSSTTQAVLNGVNILCGIGLVTTPYAAKEGGWLSLSLLVIFCGIACYTGILLMRCLESNSGLETYPDIGQAAFGRAGRLAIAGSCVELITMISDNLTSLFSDISTSFAGIFNLDSHQIFAISATLVILPTVWLKNLSLLSYFSIGGVVASILVALCLLWVGVVNKIGFHARGTTLDIANLPATIGIYGYAFSGHAVFPSIYTSMSKSSRFPYVLVTSFIFCVFLYTGVTVCAFLMFGDSTKSQFTLNMPKEFVASKIAIWTMVVNPITKYALTLTPVTLSLEELLPLALRESYIVSIVVRTFLVLSTLIVALTVPFFVFYIPMCLLSQLIQRKTNEVAELCSSQTHPQSSASASPSPVLALPLKTQQIPSGSLPRSPNKLPFRHNVSLTVSLTVGSPPQNVTMVIDTGSELSWLNCNKTEKFPQTFDPNRSSSYSPVQCSSPTCTNRTQDFTIPASCDSNNLCHATLSYADFSSSEGNLASDAFHIGSSQISGLVFGCMDSSFSSNSEEDSKNTGLMGMNRGCLSFISQMAFPKFSYCISGSDFSGLLLLGDSSNFSWISPLNYTPLIQISTQLPYFDRVAYTVQPVGIKVSGKLLPIPKSVFEPDHTGAGQTMVDSGTQFSFLLGPAYSVLRDEFLNQTKGILNVLEDSNFVFQGAMDLCYRVPIGLPNLPRLPTVSLVFEGAEMSVSGESTLYPVPGQVRGNDSVHCFTFGNSDLLGVEAYLIGHHHQQNVWMEFDLEKSRIGLAQTRCDLAMQRFGFDA
ncbi:Aspartic peptidase [Parasponia andersonii]|uniref:Aspartic peptidase n=1 Tax=Parasponia andersonii TaxID=3476 RepID=A0A2P5AAN7_PARAD|nr:Aspartic peptidase [Parasponia andersonii]